MQSKFKGGLLPYILLLPTLIILVVFLYYPALNTFRLSLFRKPIRVGAPLRFVGLNNFISLFESASYRNSVTITLEIAFAVVVIGMGLSLAIAVMAVQPVRGAAIYRTLLIWPYALSPAIAGAIFLAILNPQSGLINYVFDTLFGFRPDWLGDPKLAPWAIIAASVWKNLGFNVLFYMAGLQNIPGDVQEAAAIDGANAWERFWLVRFPLLSPITFFLLITNLTYSFFEIFGMVDILTGGGPVQATNIMIFKLYVDAFENHKTGPAAAQSIVLFLLVIGLTLIQFRTTGRRVHYGA